MFWSKKKKLVTHDGPFHADDIFACASLSLLLEKNGEKFEIIRTRDEEIIKSGDYVFDVGTIYSEAENRFDHHQVGGAAKRENGIDYSSFGLVWKKFGTEISNSAEVAATIERKLAEPVDAADNGMDLVELKLGVKPYFIQDFFKSFRPNWKNKNKDTLYTAFLQSVSIAKGILTREMVLAEASIEARSLVKNAYEKNADKRIILLDERYPWEEELMNHPEPLFVIFPRPEKSTWGIETVPKEPFSFDRRKKFPIAWAGLRDEDLQKVTGVPEAAFCHRGLFMAVATSKEGAIKLANIALNS